MDKLDMTKRDWSEVATVGKAPPAAMLQSGSLSSAALTTSSALTTAMSMTAVSKRKSWNCAYYAKKKLCLLDFETDAATATAVDDATAVAAASSAQLTMATSTMAANKRKS